MTSLMAAVARRLLSWDAAAAAAAIPPLLQVDPHCGGGGVITLQITGESACLLPSCVLTTNAHVSCLALTTQAGAESIALRVFVCVIPLFAQAASADFVLACVDASSIVWAQSVFGEGLSQLFCSLGGSL